MKFGPVVQEEMLSKDISYLELWQPLCSVDWFRRKYRLKLFLIRSSGSPFVQPERNHLCFYGRGYQEEQFCKIILNLGQWFRRCRFKDFLFGALAALLFSGEEPFMQF